MEDPHQADQQSANATTATGSTENPHEPAEHDDDSSDSNGGDSTSSSEEEEESTSFHFESDEAAEAVRTEGLKAYNEGRFNEALDDQYRVVRYFADKYGATSPKCGKYFLDYGLSQLRLLQSQKSVEDALQPRDEEAIETCYINLEVARVALQKAADGAAETELAVAEVHNALAQLSIEQEDFEGALRQYEVELLIYRGLQEDESGSEGVVSAGRMIGVLYGIADCFMKECDFEGAEERLEATLEEVRKYPAGTIDRTLVVELEELLADAKDMKGGKYQEIQEVIKQQFAAEAESLPTAREFYEVSQDGKHPFLSSLPGGSDGPDHSFLSMPTSTTGQVLALNEHSNSQSISLFPPQGSRGAPPTGAVQHVAVRKKPKAAVSTEAASDVEPVAKRTRLE